MSDESPDSDTCIVCGKPAERESGFSHLYHNGRRFALCCPICIQMFQRSPDRFASGESCKTQIEEMLDDIKWKNTG